MIPVVTPAEMAAVDSAAAEPTEVLVHRAGGQVARAARRLLGGTYGRRIVVVAGKGNNGNDGRDAADRLRRAGAHVVVIPADEAPDRLPEADLVIDAAYGTGFRGEYRAPDPSGAPVLAVDIPSGVDGLTGELRGEPPSAAATVTFQALKPGLALDPGRWRAGQVEVADIGLPLGTPAAGVIEAVDVASCWPRRRPGDHKWHTAVFVCAGSDGMTGAARMAARGAMRAGAGMVRVGSRAGDLGAVTPLEAVGRRLPETGWAEAVCEELVRFRAMVVGPGLGRDDATVAEIRRVIAGAGVPVIVDADGLFALETSKTAREVIDRRQHPTILTPHAGEFARMFGSPFGPDRVEAVRHLAADTGAIVLLKGPTTIVAAPDGRLRLITTGDERLATAGTGDVLSGLIAAAVIGGADALDAAAAAAWVHAAAANAGPRVGVVAGDTVEQVPAVLSEVLSLHPGAA